jgi:hypothetical protein
MTAHPPALAARARLIKKECWNGCEKVFAPVDMLFARGHSRRRQRAPCSFTREPGDATGGPGLLRGDIRCVESSSPFNLAQSSRALRTVRGLVITACIALIAARWVPSPKAPASAVRIAC